ncbi:pre-mRNA-splicing factor 18-like [Desmodus rotundus]|uniref:pre-mRNA-splicing factor 18-like n=1 Tax=Desmodus rotundus TaxID=9430 RepID=UPI002380EEBB|nr:pre-mRNA-splicing factor 18-like [Desmodus rotundus]
MYKAANAVEWKVGGELLVEKVVKVIRRLRERGEPIRLFGETDYDAFQRLRKIEILTPEVNKFLLGVWAKELNAREDYVKRSVQGKLNSATQKQTESYLRPLFRKLRKRNLPADIKESITDIIKFMLQREYVKANDAYLQMAIGNAP